MFVRKLLFYVKKAAIFYKIYFCKKAAFLCKNPAFLHINFREKKELHALPFRPFDKPIYRTLTKYNTVLNVFLSYL